MTTFIFFIIFMVLLSFLLYILYQYNWNYKYKRSSYYSESYIESNKNRYLNLKNIPNIPNNPLFQTYHDKSKIPNEIYENIRKYAPEYTHIIMDDNDIRDFLKIYYNKNVLDTFDSLKSGAHKADLARYCILYLYGGLYLDIKTELIKPLKEIFNKGDDVFYSVDAYFDGYIYQGIIKTPQYQPLFLSLIDYICKTKNPFLYLDFCRDLYVQLEKYIKDGIFKDKNGLKYYLLKEKCSNIDNSMCYDGFDRYGFCCFIYDKEEPVIKGRRSSYPWK